MPSAAAGGRRKLSPLTTSSMQKPVSGLIFFERRIEIMKETKPYQKAEAEIVLFNERDVIATSGGIASENGCETWSSQNGYQCHGGLQFTDDSLKPPLS